MEVITSKEIIKESVLEIMKKMQKKIDSLEKDKLDLFTGYTVLIKQIQEQKEEIAQLKGE